ncbi:response regulator transcription factor [Cupriavidus respiraculi]|uniref:Transcriptional activator protein ExaE n=1 Tax=Cupriavidus respiraculi TaxID=195930 RepID=A0ABN7YZT5_9BURK|nr:response regulator transcription factor [Cupriavidus respiraculi]MBY4949220.1 response regulator transcription factor [Cupriavidus respiraculi]CAG9177282.1 Transcriptional activator protein ExaE [Cupriavidus respiraculi]
MSHAAPTLLVVDDHPMALSGTTAFLAEVMPDVAVHAAGSAKEALGTLQRGLKPDIVLLDIWLNDGTGFDAMQALKSLIPGARFIFMSAEATPEIVSRARALSACGFVGKHLDANAFSEAVRRVLAGDTSFPTAEALSGQAGSFGPAHGIPVTPAELGLTPRQGSVLALVLEGLPNKVIARRLGLTENTVKEHVSAILQRLGVRTRMQVMSRMERFRLRQ